MIRLLLVELRRSWILFIRYPSEAITGIVSLTAIFLALFLGARYIAGGTSQFGDRLDSVIVNYLLWSLTTFSLGELGWTIQFESQTGTLEQLYLSPFGPIRIFLFRAIADLLVQLAMIITVMAIILLISRRSLHFSAGIILPILTAMLATFGLGYMLAGMTLIFKRIQNALQLSQFVVLFMIITPVEHWHGFWQFIGAFIPIAPSAGILRVIMTQSIGVQPITYLTAVLNGAIYFLLGLALFRLADRAAKRRGSLGGY